MTAKLYQDLRVPLGCMGLASLLLCTLIAPTARAETITSGGPGCTGDICCSRENVRAAVEAAVEGDVVQIPAGSCTWSGAVNMTKRITVQGEGPDSTIITVSGPEVTAFRLQAAARLSEVGLRFPDTQEGHDAGVVKVSSPGFRIDHCHLTNGRGGYGIWIETNSSEDSPAGVIDHCTFVDSRILVNGLCSSLREQQAEYFEPDNLGSSDAVYIEDNHFTRTRTGNVIDSNRAARWVARFNTGEDAEFMAHGRNTSINERGTRTWEIYHNTFNATGEVGGIVPIFLRSGVGVIFNNTVTGSWSWTENFLITSDRSLSSYGAPCDGNHPMDGQGDGGWPCRDQVGAGQDEELSTVSGDWPDMEITWAQQQPTPIHAWDNSSRVYTNAGQYVVEDRDFYDSHPNSAQTGPGQPFDGTTGVGYGSFDHRPLSCQGEVAYWATDRGVDWNHANEVGEDGCLFKCRDGQWTENCSYTPFTYPHPLTSDSVAAGDCAAAGGVCCSTEQQCTGTINAAEDCVTCCIGGVCEEATSAFPVDTPIEAEQGVLSAGIELAEDDDASEGLFVVAVEEDAGSVSFVFDVPVSGFYVLRARVHAPDGGSNSFYVGLDGADVVGDSAQVFGIEPNAGFSWLDVSLQGSSTTTPEHDPMIWDLSAGEHTFTFYGREMNTQLDMVSLDTIFDDTEPDAGDASFTPDADMMDSTDGDVATSDVEGCACVASGSRPSRTLGVWLTLLGVASATMSHSPRRDTTL